ncbi:MAG: RNA 2',3'-cyclic phosphodiesterase [Eubacteriales bacterium]|nr:RNA 2',3'-cyclic phosphodiesterase [Eubacteriales bacterium]
MRLFIAYDFDESTIKKISDIQNVLKKNAEKGRWPYFRNIHLTLKFIGEVDSQYLPEIEKTLDDTFEGMNIKPMIFQFDKLAFFRGNGNIRIAWVGLRGETKFLELLHQTIDDNLAAIGLKKENKPYIPHITIGRDIFFDSSLFELNEALKNHFEHQLRIGSATLYQSIQTGGKRIYKPLKTYTFFNKR